MSRTSRHGRARRRWLASAVLAAALCCALATAAGGTSADASPTLKIFFGKGEQLTSVQRPGSTVQDALTALVAGPTPAETADTIRTYVPVGSTVRSVTQNGTIATVDLGAGFMRGTATDTTLARLDQLVSTVTSVPGVTAVRVLIAGGTPLGLFPGIDATVPLTRASLATPDVPATTPAAPTGPVSSAARSVQQRLADLGYLLPASVDGKAGPATETAITAFQKWQGLDRTGIADAQTQAALSRAQLPAPISSGAGDPKGRRIEILLDRQLVLAIQDDRVVRTIDVSTGKPSTPTPPGSFKVYAQFPKWWSVPFQEWLLFASPFNGGIAMHQYPEVPPYAASHGCVRVTQYDAPWLYAFVSVGTPVRVIASSR
jgi:lipoprotein-anchoring transpeptidase ErfK/SrfK